MDGESERGLSSVDSLAIIKASGDAVINPSPPGKLQLDNPPLFSSTDEGDQEFEVKRIEVDREDGNAPTDAEGEVEREQGDGLSVEAKGTISVTDLYKGKEEMRQRGSTEDVPIPAQTQTRTCCDKEGHICFDCFPIPEKLLEQLRRQTGMNKLACLQTVQTVVKFYKQDLVCSKYFACEASEDDDGYSDYSHSERETVSSALLFRATPKPLRRQRGLADVHMTTNVPAPRKYDNVKFKAPTTASTMENGYASSEPTFGPGPTAPTRPSLRLCVADKFRNMARTLQLESGRWDWDDPQNVSFLFTFFSKLNKVVANLDSGTLKRLIAEEDFGIIWIMARFLRKEKRWSVEWEILSVLGVIAARDSRSRKRLLDSNFPGYLARVIQDPNLESPKLGAYAELLTVLLSGGKPLPVDVMEHLDQDFIALILDMIEYNESRPGWALPDVLVKLLLAYNMQFDSNNIYGNVTIAAISQMGGCKFLTSRLIDWLENKDSPLTKVWEGSISVHQCVIKMVTDIFLCRKTSHLFSIKEAVALMTLLTKGLSSFRAGDKRRTSYLKLIQTILRHCKYDYVRNNPSMDNLQEILCELSELAYHDQAVIRSIFNEFPQVKPQPQLEESYDY